MTKNKALLIITIIAIIVALALAIFYFFFMGESEPYEPVTPGDVTFPIGPDVDVGGGSTGDTETPYQYEYYNRPQTFEKEKQRLRLISSLPVSGATLFDRNTETFIRYVERANGHIYEVTASKEEAPYRISKTTIPKIYEAHWVNDGQGVVIRYLKDTEIQTFYARIRTSAATSTEQDLVDGTFLPSNISTFSVSEAGDRIFYMIENAGETLGYRANPNGTQRVLLFNSAVREWLSSWAGNSNVLLTTKPSSSAEGFVYAVNASTGNTQKILASLKGLTALPNSNLSYLLFADTNSGRLILKSFNIRTGTTNDIGINTLPEKCVWSTANTDIIICAAPDFLPSTQYPDAWYQGTVSFTDNLWRINLATGETKIILTPQLFSQTTMDIINLTLNKTEKYILFMNKKDLSLWLFDLSE